MSGLGEGVLAAEVLDALAVDAEEAGGGGFVAVGTAEGGGE